MLTGSGTYSYVNFLFKYLVHFCVWSLFFPYRFVRTFTYILHKNYLPYVLLIFFTLGLFYFNFWLCANLSFTCFKFLCRSMYDLFLHDFFPPFMAFELNFVSCFENFSSLIKIINIIYFFPSVFMVPAFTFRL